MQHGENLEPGYYTPEALRRALEESFASENRIQARNYSPSAVFLIEKNKESRQRDNRS